MGTQREINNIYYKNYTIILLIIISFVDGLKCPQRCGTSTKGNVCSTKWFFLYNFSFYRCICHKLMIFFSVQECHSPYIPWRLQRIHRRAVRAGNRALPTARDLDADTLLGAGWLPLPPSLPAYWKPFGFAFKLKCNQIELGWMKGWWTEFSVGLMVFPLHFISKYLMLF